MRTKEKIKIAFIANGFGLPISTSGGEVRLFNIAYRLQKYLSTTIITSEGGEKSVKEIFNMKFHIHMAKSSFIFKKEHTIIQRYLGYCFSAYNTIKYLKTHTFNICLLYTSPSPRDRTRSRMPSSA